VLGFIRSASALRAFAVPRRGIARLQLLDVDAVTFPPRLFRSLPLQRGNAIMAKNQNTFEKRRREIEKKQKAEEKRKRRQHKKDNPDETPTSGIRYGEPERE
jgi:hypothetical protein